MLENGEGENKNLQEARKYFKKAADQGNPDAQFNYAYMLYQGNGGPKNLKVAKEYFKKAVDKGHAEAQKFLEAIHKIE